PPRPRRRRAPGGRGASPPPAPPPGVARAPRLGDLPAATRTALLAAALLAQPTVGAIGRRPELEAAAVAGVITLDGDRVAFVNPILAAAVESRATPDERRAMHRELAEVAGGAGARARRRGAGASRHAAAGRA